MWPGFGENMRVLEWIIGRCRGSAEAVNTPVGKLPSPGAINRAGLEIDDGDLSELLRVDTHAWAWELDEIGDYLQSYGKRTPKALIAELNRVAASLQS